MFLGTTHAVLSVCGSVTQSGPIYLKSDLLEIGLKSDQTYRVQQSSCRHRHSDVKGNAKTLLFSWRFISCPLMLICHSLPLVLQLPLQQLPRKQHRRTVSTLLHKIILSVCSITACFSDTAFYCKSSRCSSIIQQHLCTVKCGFIQRIQHNVSKKDFEAQ